MVAKALTRYPHCWKIVLPLWTVTSKATPPIWVDLSITVDKSVTLVQSDFNEETTNFRRRNDANGMIWTEEECFRRIMGDSQVNFRIDSFPVSTFTTIEAKKDIFWWCYCNPSTPPSPPPQEIRRVWVHQGICVLIRRLKIQSHIWG